MPETYRTSCSRRRNPRSRMITLNRPEHLNAYTNPLCDEIVRRCTNTWRTMPCAA